MMQQYSTAFRIFFNHEFFSDGKLRSIVIKPTEETMLMLRNLGAIVKTFENGIYVLYESVAYGSKRSRTEFLENGGKMKFIVNNQDSSFFNYTADFKSDISCNYFLFSNSGHLSGVKKEALHANVFVDQDDFRTVTPGNAAFFIKPFGIISIKLHKELEENLKISFSSLSTYWCYVLHTPFLQELNHPAIIHKETKEAFDGPEEFMLANNVTALAFFSNRPFPFQERPEATFQLVEDYNQEKKSYRVVISALPTPSPGHVSSVKSISAIKKKDYSFIFI